MIHHFSTLFYFWEANHLIFLFQLILICFVLHLFLNGFNSFLETEVNLIWPKMNIKKPDLPKAISNVTARETKAIC